MSSLKKSQQRAEAGKDMPLLSRVHDEATPSPTGNQSHSPKQCVEDTIREGHLVPKAAAHTASGTPRWEAAALLLKAPPGPLGQEQCQGQRSSKTTSQEAAPWLSQLHSSLPEAQGPCTGLQPPIPLPGRATVIDRRVHRTLN